MCVCRFNPATNQPRSARDVSERGVTSDEVDIFSGRAHEEFFLYVDDVYDDEFSLCEDVFSGVDG